MLPVEDQRAALDLAVAAIGYALRRGHRWLPAVADLPPALRQPGAAFVTLRRGGELRGCIGSLTAREPLGIDVARHAADAAFEDPRFVPIRPDELPLLHVAISVLTAPEAMPVSSWESLRATVRPGVDGLVVESGWHRGTLLPAVWDQLPGVEEFLDALWRKAGMTPRSWPAGTVVSRYAAEEFDGAARDHLPAADRELAGG